MRCIRDHLWLQHQSVTFSSDHRQRDDCAFFYLRGGNTDLQVLQIYMIVWTELTYRVTRFRLY